MYDLRKNKMYFMVSAHGWVRVRVAKSGHIAARCEVPEWDWSSTATSSTIT
jgi:hypothetical protein